MPLKPGRGDSTYADGPEDVLTAGTDEKKFFTIPLHANRLFIKPFVYHFASSMLN